MSKVLSRSAAATVASQARLFRAVANRTGITRGGGAFTGIAPAREEPGRFRERHSDVGPPIRFHSLIKLIRFPKELVYVIALIHEAER